MYTLYMYKREYPPHTHTHKQTLGIHVRLNAPGFGAHRICACADPDFHIFRLLISQRSLYALVPYRFLYYSTCINCPVRGPRMMRKSLL